MSGFLLVLLGAWGALIPFIGPSFHYSYTPATTWTYNTGRLWLEILPGVVTLLAGLIVLAAATRPVAVFGAWLAAVSGAWFVIGQTASTLWTAHATQAAGTPVGGHITRAVEQIGFFTGLGVVIVFLAALALGRFSVIGAREASLAAEAAAAEERAAAERDARERAASQRAASRQAPGDRPAGDRPAGEPLAGRPAQDNASAGTAPSRRASTPS